jgi:lipopolysaccharide export system permease protein
MQFLWKYVDDLAGKGLDFAVLAELLFYASSGLVQMALPLSILLASLMTFGNLGENYELTAIKASGVSLSRVMRPLIVLTILISFGAFLFSNYVMPVTNLKAGVLLWDIKNKRPELNLKEGSFNNDLEDYTIKIGRKNRETGMMYNFTIYDHSNDRGNTFVNISDSALMYFTTDEKYMILTLYNGYGYEEMAKGSSGYNNGTQTDKSYRPQRRNKYQEQRVIVDISANNFRRSNKEMFRHNSQMMNLTKLEKTADSLGKSYRLMQLNFYDYLRGHFSKDFIPSSLPDSIRKKMLGEAKDSKSYVNIDSAYAKSSDNEKLAAIRNALNQVNSASSYIKERRLGFKNDYRTYSRYLIEWHQKFTMSIACLIFFLIGAPLGAIIRKGGLGTPAVVSVFFFILYYMISLVSAKFVREGYIFAYTGVWFSTVILFPLGIFLTYKATRDSALMSSMIYKDIINKITKKFFKKEF